LIEKIRTFFEFVKFEHTIFALPFAYIGAILAARGVPDGATWFWITLAMVGARTAGMGWNRIIDREIDAKNPRTQNRALQTGRITLPQAKVLVTLSLLVLIFAAWQLHPICLALFPVALFLLWIYSYVKRFHWATHLVLGLVLACAPIGGWVAVEGRLTFLSLLLGSFVLFWVAGFDVMYACQDVAFDQRSRVHSLPSRFGVSRSLQVSAFFHLMAMACLVFLGVAGSLGMVFWIGWVVVAFILLMEHRLISPQDLSRINQAFFTLNGWVSVVFFVAVFMECAWRR